MSQDTNTSNAAPAAPIVSSEQHLGGMVRITVRPANAAAPEAEQDFAQPGTPITDDPLGPRIGFADGTPSSTYERFSVAEMPQTTSFRNAFGQPCAPRDAKTVVCGNGMVTSVEAAVHLGLVEMHNDGPRASGKVLRGGEIIDGEQAARYLQAEQMGSEWNEKIASKKAIAAAYGPEAAQQWWIESGGQAAEDMLRARDAQVAQAGADPRFGGRPPALTPIPEAEWNAMQQARATAEQQTKAQAEHARTLGIPERVDADVPQLRAAEVAQTHGIKPDSISFLRHALAESVVTGGGEAAMQRAIGVFASENGVTAARANEIASTIGNQLGAPIKLLAERTGVNPNALMAAMQQSDPVAFSDAFVAIATQRNASPVLRLAMRTLNAARARGNGR